MAFIQLYNLAKIKNLKDVPKIGEVIDNNDPLGLRRVKVKLEGMFEPTDTKGSNLPWINQLNDVFLSGNDTEQYSVPSIGSVVQLVWPYDDKHVFYRGVPHGNTTSTGNFNSPDEWGWADTSGFCFKVNKITGEFTIKTAGGYIKGDSGGNITISGGNITLQGNTTISGKEFLSHTHTNGNNGGPTGGVI